MSGPQGVTNSRRPILRFDLASINIDGQPNAYKNPQLVLKSQLELPPRRPYTGLRPQTPVWRHFLMVHVKDKADELVGHWNRRPNETHAETIVPDKIRFEQLQSVLRNVSTQSFAFNNLFIVKALTSFPVFGER